MKLIQLTAFILMSKITTNASDQSLYDHALKTIDGEPTTLSEHKGKVILMVNVASRCGFTRQYKGLEELYAKYKSKGTGSVRFSLQSIRRSGTRVGIGN